MLRNIATTYLARFSVVVSLVLLVPIVAPALGLETYGFYALFASVGVLLSQDLGMGATTTRFAAAAIANKDEQRLREVATASTFFFALLSLAVAVAMAAVYAFIVRTLDPPEGVNLVLVGSLFVAVSFMTMLGTSPRQLLVGLGHLHRVNRVQIGAAVVRVVSTWIAVAIAPDVAVVLAVDLAVASLTTAGFWLLRRFLTPEITESPSALRASVLKELFRFSGDLVIMGLAAIIVLQAGPILAGVLLPLAAVASYSAANRAYLFTREASNALTIALLPFASAREAVGDRETNASLYLLGTRFANGALILILVPTVIFSSTILTAWVGPEMAQGAGAMQLLILSMLVNNNHLIAVPILTGKGAIRPFAILHSLWAVSAIALSPILAASWGIVGIAAAFVIPIVVLEPVYVLIATRRIGVSLLTFLLESIARPYALAILPALGLLFVASAVPNGLAMAITATSVWLLFVAGIFWSLLLTKSERATVVTALRRRSN